jgi:hypothetical protein
MPKKKRKTKRSKEKFPSLKRNLNSKVRQEYVDYDYVDGFNDYKTGEQVMRPLTDEEKQFLEDFNNEYYNASVGKQADEGKDNRFVKGYDKDGINEVKKVQDANNARQRDLYGRIKNKVGITNLLNYEESTDLIDNYFKKRISASEYEDALIDYLDYAEDLENSTNDTDKNPKKS